MMTQTRRKAEAIAAELSPALRDIFDLVLTGADARQIARIRKRSYWTVRNQIIALLATFDVSSRLELLALFVVVPKPRRMAANVADPGLLHDGEHDEIPPCASGIPCKPVEPEPPAPKCANCQDTGRVRSGPIPGRAQGYIEGPCPFCSPFLAAQFWMTDALGSSQVTQPPAPKDVAGAEAQGIESCNGGSTSPRAEDGHKHGTAPIDATTHER